MCYCYPLFQEWWYLNFCTNWYFYCSNAQSSFLYQAYVHRIFYRVHFTLCRIYFSSATPFIYEIHMSIIQFIISHNLKNLFIIWGYYNPLEIWWSINSHGIIFITSSSLFVPCIPYLVLCNSILNNPRSTLSLIFSNIRELGI